MNKRTNLFIAFSALLFMMMACEKADSDADFGFTNVYMPQATVAGGYYYVPGGSDSSTYNYEIDSQGNKLNVILGVARSGSQVANAFPVSITTNADTVTSLLNKGALDPSVTLLLPSSDYTLPTDLQVPDGQTSATFLLSADIDKLKTYAGKKLAVAVTVSSSSKDISLPSLSTTIVVIDVDALHL